MPGWFYNIPPQPPLLSPSIAPEDTAAGNTYLAVGVKPRADVLVRSTWAPESWSAQTGATVASQIATPVLMSQPLPANKRATHAIINQWFNSTYSLYFPPSTISGVPVVVPAPPQPQPDYTFNIAAVRSTWPEPSWEAQAESTLASIFAQVANQATIPAPPIAQTLAAVGGQWSQPEWRGQSEGAVAGALAPIQPGPVLVPSQTTAATLLQSLWPRESWGAQTAPQTTAWVPVPIIAIPCPVPHNELYSWPQEQWKAQTGANVAGQLSSAQQQIPPEPVQQLTDILASWPLERWAAQGEPGVASGLAPIVPPIFVSTPPLFQALTSIISSWPQPAWSAQTGANVASQFAQQATVATPTGPTVQGNQWLWPQDSWKAQGSPTTASLLAQLQVPPITVQRSTAGLQALLAGSWPQENWTTQRAPLGAAWIQLLAPVAPLPAPPVHLERSLWPQEQWPAQQSPAIASLFATISVPQPKAPVQQQIVSTWPTEQWAAQVGAAVASQFALVFDIPFIPQPLRTTEILSWPAEQWKAQQGATIASQLVSAPVPIAPVIPESLETIRFTWSQEQWDYQRGARNAAAFAPTPPVIPFISLPQRTQLISSWPQEAWNAQQAPNGTYISAIVQPPPPPPTTPKVTQKHANLGYKVTTRTYNLLDMVSRSWGGEFRTPDHRVYEFSNGRGFDSTDLGTTGIYRKK